MSHPTHTYTNYGVISLVLALTACIFLVSLVLTPLAIPLFIFSFFMGVVALVKHNPNVDRNRWMGIAGLSISSIGIASGFMLLLFTSTNHVPFVKLNELFISNGSYNTGTFIAILIWLLFVLAVTLYLIRLRMKSRR